MEGSKEFPACKMRRIPRAGMGSRKAMGGCNRVDFNRLKKAFPRCRPPLRWSVLIQVSLRGLWGAWGVGRVDSMLYPYNLFAQLGV